MRSFFSGKRKNPFLVLDIEDDFVKSLILRKEGNQLDVLGDALEDSGNLEEDVANSIKSAYSKFFLSANRRDKKHDNFPVLLGLPSSMLRARVVPCNLERDSTLPISKLEESEIVRRVLKRTKEKINKEFALEAGIMPDDIKYTNFKILEKNVDGYSVPSLSNFNGKDLSFKTMGVFLPKDDFIKIKSVVENLGFRISKVAHIAEALSDVSYTNDLKNIKNIPERSKYIPSLLMSYYAKEIFWYHSARENST